MAKAKEAKVTYKYNVGDKVKFVADKNIFGTWFNQCRVTDRYAQEGVPRYVMESAIGNTMDCPETDVQKRS